MSGYVYFLISSKVSRILSLLAIAVPIAPAQLTGGSSPELNAEAKSYPLLRFFNKLGRVAILLAVSCAFRS